MFVEQVIDEADKNHGEDDTEMANDGRMYQKKGIKIDVKSSENKLNLFLSIFSVSTHQYL